MICSTKQPSYFSGLIAHCSSLNSLCSCLLASYCSSHVLDMLLSQGLCTG